MRTLQNRLVLIYILVVVAYLLLIFSFYFSGFRPLAEQLKHEHRNEVSYAMDATQALVEGLIDRHLALARQTASRSAIRDAQEQYLDGEMSRAAFEDFSLEKLADALSANAEMSAIVRHAPDGRILLQAGRPPGSEVLSRCNRMPADEVELIGSARVDGRLVLVYCSPIDSPSAGRVGFDLIVMESGLLQDILEQPQYHDLRTITFGLADRDGRLSLWPESSEVLEQRRNQLQAHIAQAIPMSAGYAVESRTLESAAFELYAVVDEQQFFARIDRQLRRWIGVLSVWGGVILLVTLIALRHLLSRAIQVQDLTLQVRRDGMTGLYNHHHMEVLLDAEIARNRRYGSGFSILMLDLDHFKAVNDRHGHPVGDRVLKTTAEVLQSLARDTDQLARYGGEEFMLIMPETDADGARRMAERLRGELGATRHHAGREVFSVTISAGLVTCPEGVASPAREELVKLADDAMYSSKRNGRNCITQRVLAAGGQVETAAAPSA